MGHPCLIELCMGIGSDMYPLICIFDVAFAYRFFIPVMILLFISNFSRTANRYLCAIFSKASLKSMDITQRGVADSSACAIALLMVVAASKILFPGTQHNCLSLNFSIVGRIRSAKILARIL